VPWAFDEEASEVTRIFTGIKMRLMPYLYAAGLEAAAHGTPVLRPMLLEFPDDPAVGHLDRQYMLGPDLLVAPVFSDDGKVEFYLPAGTWTYWFTGERVTGPGWMRETHGFTTLPLYVRDGAVLAISGRDDRPDHDYLDGLVIDVYPSSDPSPGTVEVDVTSPVGGMSTFTITREAGRVTAASTSSGPWSLRIAGGTNVPAVDGLAEVDMTG
jgi:alpha-D-xyloside xylohydrolase